MKISRGDSPSRGTAEPKYVKSRQTGIRHSPPRGIAPDPGIGYRITCYPILMALTSRLWQRRKDGASNASRRVKAVLWYSPEQWSDLRNGPEEVDDLGKDYAQWQKATEAHIASLESAGHQVVRVDVDVPELRPWCLQNQLPLSGSARFAYASEKVRRQLSLAQRATTLRKLWRCWLALLVLLATTLVVWRWYYFSPFSSLDAERSLGALMMLAVLLLGISGVGGMGMVLVAGIQALRHRGGVRREYIRLGVVAAFSISLLFAVWWVDGALQRQAIGRVTVRGALLVNGIGRYQQEHGRPPRTLTALVPEFMESIPSTGIGVCPQFQYRLLNAMVTWYDLGLHHGDYERSLHLHAVGHPSRAHLAFSVGFDNRVTRVELSRLPRRAGYDFFDPDRWQREPASRASMARDLVASGILIGRSPPEVVRLLGKSTGGKQGKNTPWELTFYCYQVLRDGRGPLTYRPGVDGNGGFSPGGRDQRGRWTYDPHD